MRSLGSAYPPDWRRLLRQPARAIAVLFALAFSTPNAVAQDGAVRSTGTHLGLLGQARPAGIFGAPEISLGKPEDVRQWDDFRRRYEGEKAILDRCVTNPKQCPNAATQRWSLFLASQRQKPRSDQIEAVNRYVNGAVAHDSDANVYGLSDYWATPLEFLERTGDCEDFAILKFVSLLYLGFANDEMRLVIALDRSRNIGHAVLAVRHLSDEEILDTSYTTIWPASLIADYAPEYSLNLTTRWAHFPLGVNPGQILAQSRPTSN